MTSTQGPADAGSSEGCVSGKMLMDTLVELVQKGDHDGTCAVLSEPAARQQLGELAWDLVPCVCSVLSEPVAEEHPGVLPACERVLTTLAEVARPKELLLVLLEQANYFNDDPKYKGLLHVMQKCLLRLPSKRSQSLALALSTLYAHIQTLPKPPDFDPEGEERKLMDSDDNVRRCNDVVAAFVFFIDPFIKEVSLAFLDASAGQQKLSQDKNQRKELLHVIVKMLNHPLPYLDVARAEKTSEESGSVILAEQLMERVGQVCGNPIQTIESMLHSNALNQGRRKQIEKRRQDKDIPVEELVDMDELSVEEDVPLQGLAMWAYLMFGEGHGKTALPCVYTKAFYLEFSCPFILHFLKQPRKAAVYKGLQLMQQLLADVPEASLAADTLEHPQMTEVAGALIQVMISNSSKAVRSRAVKLLPLTLSRLCLQGRYHFLFYLLKAVNHAGVAGYAMQMLKDQIDANLKLELPAHWFCSPPLEKLLAAAFSLRDGATTDLLEDSERIMGGLNLLRYLVLRDSVQANCTGVWTLWPRVEQSYLEPLRTGLNMSRAHYQLELDKAHKGQSRMPADAPDMSVNVGGETMPKLTQDQEREVMHMALHTFDMMESIMGRIGELVEQKKREHMANTKL